jgi:hypothetical protein
MANTSFIKYAEKNLLVDYFGFYCVRLRRGAACSSGGLTGDVTVSACGISGGQRPGVSLLRKIYRAVGAGGKEQPVFF